MKLFGVWVPLFRSLLLGKYVDLLGFCYDYFWPNVELKVNGLLALILGADLSRSLLFKKLGVLFNPLWMFMGWYWKDDGCIAILLIIILFAKYKYRKKLKDINLA